MYIAFILDILKIERKVKIEIKLFYVKIKMTSFQVTYQKLVKNNIPDNIVRIIFDYAKCQYEGCYNFGDEELITFEGFGGFDGFYCFNHLDEVTQEIEELLDEFNSYRDDEFEDDDYYDDADAFTGWDFGASVDI